MAGNILYLGSQLIQTSGLPMQLPQLASDPTGVAGYEYYNTTSNTVRYYNGTAWGSASGTGTVTSVALADGSTTPIFAISGSPITGSGTLTFTLSNENANLVFSGPTSGGAAQPGFRSLVANDIPSLTALYESVNNFSTRTYNNAITLAANISSATTIAALTFAYATYGSVRLDYEMVEAATSARRIGTFVVCTDGTNVGYNDQNAQSVILGNGIVLSAVVNGSNINIQFSGTGASNAVTMRTEITSYNA